MNKKGFLIITTIGFIVLFASVALHAGSDVPAVIKMQNDYEHKKEIVAFTHEKHIDARGNKCFSSIVAAVNKFLVNNIHAKFLKNKSSI